MLWNPNPFSMVEKKNWHMVDTIFSTDHVTPTQIFFWLAIQQFLSLKYLGYYTC